MVAKKTKPAAAPPEQEQPIQGNLVQDSEQPPTPPVWGAFSTDTASGQAPAPPPEQQQMPPEDTEAAKVATSRRRGKAANKAPPAGGVDNVALNTTELVHFVERIERMTEEISAMLEDRKEIFTEVKAKGYKPAILRKVLARRAMDADKRKEMDSLIDLYEEALR